MHRIALHLAVSPVSTNRAPRHGVNLTLEPWNPGTLELWNPGTLESETDLEADTTRVQTATTRLSTLRLLAPPRLQGICVVLARGQRHCGEGGETRAYPVTETEHVNNICDITTTPAGVSAEVAAAATKAAVEAVASLEGAGVFGVELFHLVGGESHTGSGARLK